MDKKSVAIEVAPPIAPQRPSKEAAPGQTRGQTPPSVEPEVLRLVGYVTAAVSCLFLVIVILYSLRSPSQTTATNSSQTPLAAPETESILNGFRERASEGSTRATSQASSATESPRPGPSPTPNLVNGKLDKYRVQVPSGGLVNMRQGPAVSFPVIQRLKDGVDSVTLIDKAVTNGSTTWQQIESGGVVGWVNADYLALSVQRENSQPTVAPNSLPANLATPPPTAVEQVTPEDPSELPTQLPPRAIPVATSRGTYKISGVMAGDFLNMRQGPAASYPITQRLENGVDGATLIGEPVVNGKTTWQQINSRGVVGWVNADYLAPSR